MGLSDIMFPPRFFSFQNLIGQNLPHKPVALEMNHSEIIALTSRANQSLGTASNSWLEAKPTIKSLRYQNCGSAP
jgi:hypothetical protein